MKKITTFLFLSIVLFSSGSYARVINGYWMNWYQSPDAEVRLGTDLPAGYQLVHIAFGELAANGRVSFKVEGTPYVNMANGQNIFKTDIKNLQAKGVKVLLSLGGQNAYYTINSEAQKAEFVHSLQQIIAEYNFDGIDYDFESGFTKDNSVYLVNATRELKNHFSAQGKNLMFTTAPETLDTYWGTFPNGKYDALIQSGAIDQVQVQFYNSGCMPGSKEGDWACYGQGTQDFIVSQVDSTIQKWKQAGVAHAETLLVPGFPASVNAAGGGYADPAVVRRALTCLQTGTQCEKYTPRQTYPEIANRVMTWSINWDKKSNYQFVRALT